jgi:hypothetical protein
MGGKNELREKLYPRLKTYEGRYPKKTTRISRGYSVCLSVCSILCSGFNETIRSADSLFGFENHRIFRATV